MLRHLWLDFKAAFLAAYNEATGSAERERQRRAAIAYIDALAARRRLDEELARENVRAQAAQVRQRVLELLPADGKVH